MSARARGGVDWRAAIGAGLIAGAVFMMLEMIMVPAFLGGSPWGPPRMIAAIVMGQGVLPSPPPPPSFDAGVLVAAMVVHFVLSVVYALIFAAIAGRLAGGMAALVGAGFGLVLYLVNFYLFTGLFPWFANARNWVSIFAHIVFGLTLALAYKGLERRAAPPTAPVA